MKHIFILFCAGIVLAACAPHIVVKPTSLASVQANQSPAEVVFLTPMDSVDLTCLKLGQIKILEAFASKDCAYGEVKALAIEETNKLGGNLFVITKHLYQNGRTCHSLCGDVYSVPDPLIYRCELLWTSAHRLEESDFLGQSYVSSGKGVDRVGFRYHPMSFSYFEKTFPIVVETFVNCNSIIGIEPLNSIAQLQLEFDISEVYARHFVGQVKRVVTNYSDWMYSQKDILSKYQDLLEETLSDCRNDIASDPSKLEYWKVWVAEELEKTRGSDIVKSFEVNKRGVKTYDELHEP